MKTKTRLGRILPKVVLCFALLILLGAIAFFAMQLLGRYKLTGGTRGEAPKLHTSELAETHEEEEDWQEGDVRYQGVHYRYNEDIMTFLFLGIDKEEEVELTENAGEGGQSDTIFLLVLNPHNKEISIISVNRNTMTDIDLYNEDGGYLITIEGQLTLQHAFGDGAEISCERSAQAVSNLFYGLPINGYCSINMGAIPLINDAVGGVDLQVLEDVVYTDMKEGDLVHLEGEDAYNYLHNRDTGVVGSADGRLERQKQYLTAYAATAMERFKEDITLPVTLYSTLSKYMVTDVTLDEVSYLATQVMGYHFGEESMYSVQGETRKGERYEEFYPDETALYELILQIFYEEAGSQGK